MTDQQSNDRTDKALDNDAPIGNDPFGLPRTSATVASAVRHFRTMRELSRDELAWLLAAAEHDVGVERLEEIEDHRAAADVDDLTAIACALEVSPAELLGHVPVEAPVPDGEPATGLPADVSTAEYRDWLVSKTSLDREGRLAWHRDLVERLRIRATHVEDQLRGLLAHMDELGELIEREHDMPAVQRMHDGVRDSEERLVQLDLALAAAERRIELIQQKPV